MALPDPVLYGQFQHLDDIDIVLSGLLEIGFQKVFETAKAAEILSDYARHAISSGETRVMPQISSACPTIMRLIRMRFPKLIPNIAATVTPVELAAILARGRRRLRPACRRRRSAFFPSCPAPPR